MRTDSQRGQRPRVIGVLNGDVVREAWARTKFGGLFRAMEERFELVEVYDATLQGKDRLLNALLTFHPQPQRWKQRFYMNVPAFRQRSQRVAEYLDKKCASADVIFQVGVLLDSHWKVQRLPSVIYTDYTASLSAKQPDAGRSPFNKKQLQRWLTLERQAFQRSTHVCTWSDFTRRSLIGDYQMAPERVTTVGGGVNFVTLPKLVRRESSQPPTALFIGKDFYRKGGDRLLQAFAQVRREIPNARLLLLTRSKIPPELPQEGIELIAPTWNRDEIAQLYRRADLFVLPSRLETWGDVLLEASAYGLPCIGVSGKAMAEIIVNGKTGLLVPPDEDDTDTLASAMKILLANPSLRQDWGHAARQRVEERFTWQKVVERMAPVIERAAWLKG